MQQHIAACWLLARAFWCPRHVLLPVCVQDAWLQAESDSARKQVEAVLYSPEGWNMAQSLVAEDCPAWEADSWQPQAAEEVRG